MKTQTNTIKEQKDYCNNCERWIRQEEFNGSFRCELCGSENITTFYSDEAVTAEELINETETEQFTLQERADLNLSKCLRGQK